MKCSKCGCEFDEGLFCPDCGTKYEPVLRMKCSKCGCEFDEGLFCPDCGTKYEEEKAYIIKEKATEKEQANQNSGDSTNKKLEDKTKGVAVPIILLIASIIAFLLSFCFGIGGLLAIPVLIISLVIIIGKNENKSLWVSAIIAGITIIVSIIVLAVSIGNTKKNADKIWEDVKTIANYGYEEDTSSSNNNDEPKKEQGQEDGVSTTVNASDTNNDIAEDIHDNNNEESIFEDAYKAYYDYLSQNPQLKIPAYNGDVFDNISFFDCFGNEYPEMIYESNEQTTGDYFNLHIASFDGNNVSEIETNVQIDAGAAGAPSYRLFTIDESKKIYGIDQCYLGDGYYMEFFTLMENNGKLQRADLYNVYSFVDYDSGLSSLTYQCGDKILTQEEFEKEIGEMIKDVKVIYKSTYYYDWDEDPFSLRNYISEEMDVLNYDNALLFLKGKISTEMTIQSSIDYESIYKSVLKEYADAYYDEYFDEENYQFLSSGFWDLKYIPAEEIGYIIKDINNDGTAELLIGDNYSEEGSSFIWGGYTYKDGKIIQFLDGWYRNEYCWIGNGEFYNYGSSSAWEAMQYKLKINSDATAFIIEECYFTKEDSSQSDGIAYYHRNFNNEPERVLSIDEFPDGIDDISKSEVISSQDYYDYKSGISCETLVFNTIW